MPVELNLLELILLHNDVVVFVITHKMLVDKPLIALKVELEQSLMIVSAVKVRI
jgi:hypothetical protein